MLNEIFAQVLPEQSQYMIEFLGKNEGFVFSADVKSDARITWTLPDLLNSERTYITASTFFGRKRQRRFLRHVLAIVCDFDTEPNTTPEDIVDRYHKVGLPIPELIISTTDPGHYQAWNIFDEPLRNRNKLLETKITKIHECMAEALGSDPNAVGPERWVRRPHKKNIMYVDYYSRTSWNELTEWYEARRTPKNRPVPYQKVVFIGKLLGTEAGQRIQEPAAEVGVRNSWAYGLGLCLYDAGIPDEVIHDKLHEWNKALKEPLKMSEIEKIYRSVMTGHHHASAHVLEAITGCSAQIKGWYKWAKPRDRRRDHLEEVGEDIINDLLQKGLVIETQQAWAARLGVAYRTLKAVLGKLRKEGIVDANIGRGRYSQSSYKLSEEYLKTIKPSILEVASTTEVNFFEGNLKGHIAISPLKGTLAFLATQCPVYLNNKVRAG